MLDENLEKYYFFFFAAYDWILHKIISFVLLDYTV